MDDERAPVKAKLHSVIKGSRKGRSKKRWKEVIEKLVSGFERPDAQLFFVESWLQELIYPCLQEKLASFQEICKKFRLN